jgi:hypothetical protein
VAERLVGFEQALKDRLRAAPVMHHSNHRPLTSLQRTPGGYS